MHTVDLAGAAQVLDVLPGTIGSHGVGYMKFSSALICMSAGLSGVATL
jgi:hypothetical protein